MAAPAGCFLRACRHRRSACFAVLALVVCVCPEPVRARVDMTIPDELHDATLYPGLRGILELSGDTVHNCGNLLLHVTNFGIFGSLPGSGWGFEAAPSAQWPSGSETEYLYVGGLWVGAVRHGEPAVTTAAEDLEFRPGRSELDVIYRASEGLVGGARSPLPNADDDGDGQVDEDWLDGRDNDSDDRIDEDFAAISNQMFFAEYTDVDPEIQLLHPEHKPLGIRVQQKSLCWQDPLVDDFIAFEFTVINDGHEPLYDVYVGFFVDPDIGPRRGAGVARDDLAGFWEGTRSERLGGKERNLKVSIGYMWDEDGDDGASPGFVGLMFLGAGAGSTVSDFVELHNARFFSGTKDFASGGDPHNDDERYQVLSGAAPQSLPPPNPVTGVRPASAARKPDDYRIVLSAGPFEVLEPGDQLTFQTALVIGTGFEGMLKNAAQAQLTFDGVFLNCDDDPTTGTHGAETAVCAGELTGERLRIDPCNTACDLAPQSDPLCWVTVPSENCVWINGDCEWEEFTDTVTGVDGNECLVRWLISSAPPSPRMRVVASEGRVDLLFDNRSELSPDLRLGEIDFESYRIWRADNWTRPFGTSVHTGPGNALWLLLAEYDVAGNGIGSERGLDAIAYTPQIPTEIVEFYAEWFAQHPLLLPPDLPGFTPAEIDTAKNMARGGRYYRFTDPPFVTDGVVGGRCPTDGLCPPFTRPDGSVVSMRCNAAGRCQESFPSPHSGQHYFYAVTATDHKLRFDESGASTPVSPGLAGSPSGSFVFVNPPTRAVPRQEAGSMDERVYVVPNPATAASMQPWTLRPHDSDPTGVKVEFHHLPRARGSVRIYTLSSDLVIELPFDGRDGNGSLAWNLLSRNGQEITSGVYMFVVEAPGFERFVDKFVVIR